MKIPEVQESVTYFNNLQKYIEKAKKRILIQVMIFEIVPQMEIYVSLLSNAAKRGVNVYLVLDWISERYYDENLDVYPAFRQEKKEKRQRLHLLEVEMIKVMEKAGVHVVVENTPAGIGNLFLLGKRNHNKIFIIDD